MNQQNFRHRLYIIIFEADTFGGKLFDVLLLIFILLSVLTFCLESVSSFRANHIEEFRAAEWFFTILFTIEYLLRIYSAPKPFRYMISFFGVVDLLAILPTYLSLIFAGTQFLAVVRVLRLLRMARVLKLTKFITEGHLLRTALRASIPKITVFIGSVLSIIVVIGSLMYFIEGPEHGFTSIPKSMYWTIVTLTTVGYGDITPQTPAGKMLASMVMLLGYGIIAIPTGIVSVEIAHAERARYNTRICPNCHTEGHEALASFCYNCGYALRQNTPPSA